MFYRKQKNAIGSPPFNKNILSHNKHWFTFSKDIFSWNFILFCSILTKETQKKIIFQNFKGPWGPEIWWYEAKNSGRWRKGAIKLVYKFWWRSVKNSISYSTLNIGLSRINCNFQQIWYQVWGHLSPSVFA